MQTKANLPNPQTLEWIAKHVKWGALAEGLTENDRAAAISLMEAIQVVGSQPETTDDE